VAEIEMARQQIPTDSRPKPARAPRWQLTVPFGYVASGGRYRGVPPHTGNVAWEANSTDLASVPPALWGILAPFGQQMRPALLHDRRCVIAGQQASSDKAQARATRKEADYLFRDALGDEGVSEVRRWLFWTGVSFSRFLGYARRRAIALAVCIALTSLVGFHALAVTLNVDAFGMNRWPVHLAFWIVVAAIAVISFMLRWLTYALVVPAILLFIALCFIAAHAERPPSVDRVLAAVPEAGWRNLAYHGSAALVLLAIVLILGFTTDWRAALIAVAVGPLVLAVLVMTTLAEFVLALPDRVIWRLRSGSGVGPQPLPTMLRWNRMT